MLIFRRKLSNGFFTKKSYSVQPSIEGQKNRKNTQHTILLPKTTFPAYLKPEEVAERDRRVLKECEFLDYYKWQRQHLRGKEFVLHDGPPYANGKPHVGHAVNKILKDIILRSQLIQGNRVHYIPGWDCHGLPIENVATKDRVHSLSPIEIRQKAKEIAFSMSQIQMKAFKQWGVIGDWNSQCYYTYDIKYIVNQLLMFWKLYEKGLIYYDLKPVYWSPSSQTALAESELVYKDHISKSLFVRFETVQASFSEPVYLLVWTTTPWTIPLNKAVYYSPNIKYSLVKVSTNSGLYIVASDLIKQLEIRFQKSITVHSEIPSELLSKLRYKQPWERDQILNVYKSESIELAGTGLLHSVPGHGHEDFVMALTNKLEVESFVDEKGCYTSGLGNKLEGLNVLEEGYKAVLEHLSSDIVSVENYNHSYPYDWRTNKPVIIRASNQWFIDTNQLKEKAIENLRKLKIPQEYFITKLKVRPYWCLSRQRAWGIPIPAFFHKQSKRPLLSKNLIHHLCKLFESCGSDVWWQAKIEELFPANVCRELFVESKNVIKGEDIMDIWFDSGISWSYALDGKKSDLYLEGKDQFGGWFQSSILTSVAAGNGAPFKQIMTHGFVVDKNGKKMSKSIGNVIDPEDILNGKNAFGVDTLRWWVGSHSQQNLIPISNGILKSDSDNVHQIRKILRFLLGALNNTLLEEDSNLPKNLQTIDRYILNTCYKFYHSVISSYNDYNIYNACSKILYFVSNEISSRYIAIIRDRLYCDEKDSPRRTACLYTLNGILKTVSYVIAPILPHLAEEVFLYYPLNKTQRKLFYTENPWSPPYSWKDDSTDEIMQLIYKIKKNNFMEKSSQKLSCSIEIEEKNFLLLKGMQGGQEKSIDSELTEILQVAEVDLKVGNQNVTFSPATTNSCPRCRRYTLLESHDLCNRCESVVAKLVSYDSNCCSYFLKEFQNFMDFKKENFFGQVKINS